MFKRLLAVLLCSLLAGTSYAGTTTRTNSGGYSSVTVYASTPGPAVWYNPLTTGLSKTMVADPNTTSDVTWNGTSIVDRKGYAWTQNGTVTETTGDGASPFFPAGFSQAPLSGAGFSDANYYSGTAGTNPYRVQGGVFSVCVVYLPGSASTEMVLASDSDASHGWFLEQTAAGKGNFGLNGVAASVATGNTNLNLGVNILCAGRDSSGNIIAKLNLGAAVTGSGTTYTDPSSVASAIGRYSGGTGLAWSGRIYEVWISTTAPSDALFTKIQREYFAQTLNDGTAIAVTRNSASSGTIKGQYVWNWPAGIAPVTDQGFQSEGAASNLATNAEAFNLWGQAVSGASAPVVTANTTVAPDGNQTADTVALPAVGTGQTSAVEWHQLSGTANNSVYTCSVWVKLISGSGNLYVFGGNTIAPVATTLITPTTTWTRYTVVITTDTSGKLQCAIGDSQGFLGMANQAAVTVALWGGDVEHNPAATSYVSNTLGTRVEQVNTYVPPSIGAKISCAADFTLEGVTGSTPVLTDLYVNAGNAYALTLDSTLHGRWNVFVSTTSHVTLTSGTVSAGVQHHLNSKYDGTTATVCLDGTCATSTPSVTMPSGVLSAGFGSDNVAGAPLYGWINQLKCDVYTSTKVQ